MSEAIIELQGLSKHFGSTVAVNDLSFEVLKGDIFGFLGPNGAGKSTTLYMLAGLVYPTGGSFSIFGERPSEMIAIKRRVGAILEIPAFYNYLSALKNLEIFARIKNCYSPVKMSEILEQVGLLDSADRKVGDFSVGMKQRLGIARALLNEPELLILDEPMGGLDPEGSRKIWSLLTDLVKNHQTTILVSSHLLHEVEENCNRLAVIDKGSLVSYGKVSELLEFETTSISMEFDPDMPPETILHELESLDWVEVENHQHRGNLIISVRLHAHSPVELRNYLNEKSYPLIWIYPKRRTLNEFFLELTDKKSE